jgi:hypothetical protein
MLCRVFFRALGKEALCRVLKKTLGKELGKKVSNQILKP